MGLLPPCCRWTAAAFVVVVVDDLPPLRDPRPPRAAVILVAT
jgi:hypothetical protein